MRKLESLSLALATGVLLLGGAAASAQTPPSHTGTHPAGTTASDQTAGTTTTKTTTTTKDTAASSATESTKDSHFIKNAAEAGTTEVELGRLGADKAASSEVKQFAQHMLDDHSKANTELTSLASSKNVDIAKATEKARKSSEKLSDKAGADFDKAFMKKMVS